MKKLKLEQYEVERHSKWELIEVSSSSRTYGTPSNFKVSLPKRHVHVEAVKFAYASLPVLTSISSGSNTFTYIESDVLVTRTATIVPGTYNIQANPVSLLDALEIAISSVPHAHVYMIFYNPNTRRLTFSNVSSLDPFTLRFTEPLASTLGFLPNTDYTGVNITAPYPLNLDHNSSTLYLGIEEIGRDFGQSTRTNLNYTFAIPLKNLPTSYQKNLLFHDTELLKQYTTNVPDHFLWELTVKLMDQYGAVVDTNGLDWTFGLEVHTSHVDRTVKLE